MCYGVRGTAGNYVNGKSIASYVSVLDDVQSAFSTAAQRGDMVITHFFSKSVHRFSCRPVRQVHHVMIQWFHHLGSVG